MMRCLVAVSFAVVAFCLAQPAEAVNCVSAPLPTSPVSPVYTLLDVEGVSGTSDHFRVDLWRQPCNPASAGPSFTVLVLITPLSNAPFVCDSNFFIIQNNFQWALTLSQSYPPTRQPIFCNVAGVQAATALSLFPISLQAGQPAQPDFSQAFIFQYEGHTNFNLNVPAGGVAGPLVAAILPASRSVQVGGTPATAFVTIINSGGATASGVGISVSAQTPVPANFLYQTTDPATNALTGSPNTPKDIGPGQSQTYVIVLTPTGPFPPTFVAFNFGGTNTIFPVATLTGINTLLLSASNTPVADIVALAASGDPGIVDIPGAAGTGVFAVATVNVGVASAINVTADSNGVTLPIGILICETTPATGVCQASPTASVALVIAANATPTFGIFVTGTGNVPFDPATNRIFVRFTDANGIVRGTTSVAARTQ